MKREAETWLELLWLVFSKPLWPLQLLTLVSLFSICWVAENPESGVWTRRKGADWFWDRPKHHPLDLTPCLLCLEYLSFGEGQRKLSQVLLAKYPRGTAVSPLPPMVWLPLPIPHIPFIVWTSRRNISANKDSSWLTGHKFITKV